MKLRFGDIVISVVPAQGKGKFRIAPEYRPFLCQSQADVTVQVHCGSFPLSDLGNLIFDSGGNWSLYHQNEGTGVIFLYNRSGETLPLRMAVFAPDFLSGDVYVGGEASDSLIPYPLMRPLDAVLMTNVLAKDGGVLLHACAVSDGDRGILFVGVSGSGKSTLATLWREQEGVILLNDDCVIVRKREGRFWVFGTPWYGDVPAASPEAVPLERIFVIRHASGNKAGPLKPADAVSRLLVRSYPPLWDAKGMAITLRFLGELSQAVPCYELGFVPDESVVDFVRCLK